MAVLKLQGEEIRVLKACSPVHQGRHCLTNSLYLLERYRLEQIQVIQTGRATTTGTYIHYIEYHNYNVNESLKVFL